MSEKKITIRLETKNDDRAVENLTREAFWNVYRPGCMEHYVLHCFRTDPAFVPELDLVMELDGALIGHIMYAQPATDNSLLPHYPALCENSGAVPASAIASACLGFTPPLSTTSSAGIKCFSPARS